MRGRRTLLAIFGVSIPVLAFYLIVIASAIAAH